MKLVAATIAAAIFLFVPAAAHAETSREPDPTPLDLAAALTAAIEAKDMVIAFFTARDVPQKPITVKISGPALAVNELDPAFVTNQSRQVSRFTFIAVGATGPGGQAASLWLTRTSQGAWTLSNIAGGDHEQRYANQPGKVFREPQIGAWYSVRGGRVMPLNEQATASVGASGVTVAEYQKLVHARYADKLPGSDYQRNGLYGGDNLPAKAIAGPPASGADTQTPAAGSGMEMLPLVAGAVVLLAAMAAIRLLRAT